jgi:hypothetical protein
MIKHFATFKAGNCKVNMVNLMLYVSGKDSMLKTRKFRKNTSTWLNTIFSKNYS